MDTEKFHLFVTCAPELESLLMEELHALGVTSAYSGYRGVYVETWDWSTIYRINYASRLASRVLLPLSRFRCFDKNTLYRHAMEIDWSRYLKEGWTFAIDANVNHRQLRNSLFAAQVVKDAICDQMRQRTGRRPSVQLQSPDVQINLFIQQQMGVISFDTSGEPLHKRGYRQETTEAPVQETLAAAMLCLARYTKDQIFLDPCCGSGTLLIEAALMATNTPPGYLRHVWGFMHHPQYDSTTWLKVRNQIDENRIPLMPNHLYGFDISKNAVRATKINLKAAGFSKDIQVSEMDFREWLPTFSPNFILTNPPHGRRLEEVDQLRSLYRALGSFMKEKCAKPAKGFIFTGSAELSKEVGLAAKRRYVLSNGGIESRLLEYDLY